MSTALALLPSGAGWHTQVSWSDLDGVWRDFGDLGFWLGTTTPSTPVVENSNSRLKNYRNIFSTLKTFYREIYQKLQQNHGGGGTDLPAERDVGSENSSIVENCLLSELRRKNREFQNFISFFPKTLRKQAVCDG